MSPQSPQPVSDRFRYKTADELLAQAQSLGLSLPFSDPLAPLFAPGVVAGRTVPNRMAAQPMEGCDGEPSGAPGALTIRRYLRFAEGGFGLLWFEATAVMPEARANARQLYLTPGTLPAFRALVEDTRAAAAQRFGRDYRPYCVVQLTHSGRFSRTAPPGRRKVACHNPLLDRDALPVWTDEELDRVREAMVDGARLAKAAGFDAVDIKACHGYLLHELLGARTREHSRYGGPFENRVRLLLESVQAVRAEVPGIAVAVRMNATDGMPQPWGFGAAPGPDAAADLDEPRRLARLLGEAGCSLLNITAGIPTYGPHINRPFDRPVAGTAPPPEHPLVGVVRLLELSAAMQEAAGPIPVVATGLSWLRQFWPNVAAALLEQGRCAFAGIGRGAFAYPDAPADLAAHGALTPVKCCIACSRCTELMRLGSTAGCAVRDHPLYSGLHREAVARNAAATGGRP
jgi:2,4-dienoyl-CoA reductase-like NADH-dependent reductase (Old Yellow Enzyme family)